MSLKRNMTGIYILLILFAIWIAFGVIAIRNIEKPKYEILEKQKFYELREYSPYIVARAEVDLPYEEATNVGFMKVADYIFGANKSSEKIAMTSPVVQEESEKIAMTSPVIQEQTEASTYITEFVLPSKYSLETLPIPNNPQVKLVEVDGRKLAVHRFSWYTSLSRVDKKKSELIESVEADGLEVLNVPVLARYNPPLTAPFMRRNEIWVEVK